MLLITNQLILIESLRKFIFFKNNRSLHNDHRSSHDDQNLRAHLFLIFLIVWAIGSVVEHPIDSRRVIGSNPILPTIAWGYSLVGAYPVCIRKAAVRFCLPPPFTFRSSKSLTFLEYKYYKKHLENSCF